MLGAAKSLFKSPKTFINTAQAFLGGYKKGGVKGGFQASARHGLNSLHRAYKIQQLKEPNPKKPTLTRSANHPFRYPRHRLATRDQKRTRQHLEKDTGQPGIWDTIKGFYNTVTQANPFVPKAPRGKQTIAQAQTEKVGEYSKLGADLALEGL